MFSQTAGLFENGVDFVNAVATAVTPMAFYETVMVKGYATLVDPDTKVDVGTGMVAAGRLQALIESRASGTSTVQLIAQLDRIIRAIHDSVPEELWEGILDKIDGPVPAEISADDIEDWDAGEYGPVLADGNSCTQYVRGSLKT
jgi:hypothetical protein